MHRYIFTALGCFALAAAFSITPVGIQGTSLTLGAKTVLAQPGGNGNGHGKGRGGGQALGRGNTAAINGVANGHSGGKSSNGRALGHEIDGVSGVGHATAPGQAKKAAYDGYDGDDDGDDDDDDKSLKGSFNAINASKRAFEVSNYHSRVQRVRSYLDAVQELSELDDMDADLDAAITAAAEAAATASSQPVTAAMLDEVNSISNDKQLTDPDIDLENDRTEEVAEEARNIQEGP